MSKAKDVLKIINEVRDMKALLMSKAKEVITSIDEVRGMKAHNDEIMVWKSDWEYIVAIRTLDGGWNFYSIIEDGRDQFINNKTVFNVNPKWGEKIPLKDVPASIMKAIQVHQKEDRKKGR